MHFTPLSVGQRAQFETQGYLIIRNALSRETVERLVAVSDRLVQSDRTQGRSMGDEGRMDGFRNCVDCDPVYLELVAQEQTFPAIVQLLSPNIQVHTSHLIYRQPDPLAASAKRRAPSWHRDINTCPADLGHHAVPRLEIKVSFQLSDASEPGCGQTLVASGSHLLKHDLPRCDDGEPVHVVEPLLHPGDALLFENRTFHAGGANRCGRVRKNVMIGYSYRWMRPDDYIQQDESVLQQCSPIQRQLLGGSGGLFDEQGYFRAFGTERPLSDWCQKHEVMPAWQHMRA